MKKIIASGTTKKGLYLILFMLLAALLFLSACTKKECEVASDCTGKACQKASCSGENSCKYEQIANCCGNLKCETKAAENNCNCETDCKPKCEGNVVVDKKGKTEIFAKYLEQKCIGEKKAASCQVSVLQQYTTPQTIVSESKTTDVKLSFATTYKKVLDPVYDNIQFKITLADTNSQVLLPVKLTNIKILSGQILLAEKTINQELATVGDSISATVKLSYTPALQEEEKQVSFKVSFEYDKKSGAADVTERQTVEQKLQEKIALVRTG